MQVIEQTHDEKVKMYMKCTKLKLAEMLIECNRILTARMEAKNITSNYVLADSTKTDNETEIIDAYMKEARKYYPKKKQIRF